MTAAKDLVLVVDDEPQVLVALEDLLSEEFVVLKADSGERALGVIDREPNVAVVITDHRMPRMSGDELISRIADRSTATPIMVTGYADLAAVVRAVNEGRLFAYVSKPWDGDDLRLKVGRAAEHYRLAKELAEERQLLHDLMNNIPDGIYFKDLDLRFRRANRAFCRILGSDVDDVLGRTLGEIVDDAAEAATTEKAEAELLAREGTLADSTRRVTLHGAERWLSESKAAIRGAGGAVIGLVGVARDVTRRRAEEERAARVGRMRAVMSSVNAAVTRLDKGADLLREACWIMVDVGELRAAVVLELEPDGADVRFVSTAASREIARDPLTEAILSTTSTLPMLRSARGAPAVVGDLRELSNHTARLAFLEAGIGSMAALPLHGGRAGRSLLVFAHEPAFFRDDELRLLGDSANSLSLALDHIDKRQQVEFLSFYDALTGLPNRKLLLDRIEQNVVAHEHTTERFALVLVDLCRFRQINDGLGSRGGDELLVQVGRRLSSLEGVSTVARVGGDVFALLVPVVESEAVLGSVVDNGLAALLSEAFSIGGTEVRVSTRSGIAVFPSDGARTELLIASAEAALKDAKASLVSYRFYAPTMNARVAEQLLLETKLRRAVTAEEFELHYQPKVDLKSGRTVGLEALIRWRDRGTLVPPGQFIPVLEETGLIRDVGHWVLKQAASQYDDWRSAGLQVPRIAVNVSALQLAAPDFVERLERVLAEVPSATTGIGLEITESVFVDDLPGSTAKLVAARVLGLQVAIDDFGTGYSSLSYLARLPIDALKIDRQFVLQMVEDPQSATIVTTIISLAHALELKVIAEGVETREQARFLRLVKCDEIQGYLFSKPVPASDVPALLGRRFSASTVPAP